MTVAEAAALLGRSKITVWKMLDARILTGTKGDADRGTSGAWDIDPASVEAALARLQAGQPAVPGWHAGYDAEKQKQAADRAAAEAATLAAFPATDHHVGPSYQHRNGTDGPEDFINCEDWPLCQPSCGVCKPPKANGHTRRPQLADLSPDPIWTAAWVRGMKSSGGYGHDGFTLEDLE